MLLALYQPEIPQNTGTLMRLCACLGINLHIIHPCGFVWNDRHLRRAGMDYIDIATVQHHNNWESFYSWVKNTNHRLVLVDAKAKVPYTTFSFQRGDILLMGQESSGIPDDLFQFIPQRVCIPMVQNCRSVNVSLAASMVVGEALRQLQIFP